MFLPKYLRRPLFQILISILKIWKIIQFNGPCDDDDGVSMASRQLWWIYWADNIEIRGARRGLAITSPSLSCPTNNTTSATHTNGIGQTQEVEVCWTFVNCFEGRRVALHYFHYILWTKTKTKTNPWVYPRIISWYKDKGKVPRSAIPKQYIMGSTSNTYLVHFCRFGFAV